MKAPPYWCVQRNGGFLKDSGSLLSFLYPSLSSAQSQALLQTSVPAPHTPIVFTLPSGSDSLVYFQEQTEKRTRKKFVFYQCVCVRVCARLWAVLLEFQGQGLYYECGMRNQHLHYKNGYVNIEATIIRRRGVGTGGDGVPIGLLAITPLTACPL